MKTSLETNHQARYDPLAHVITEIRPPTVFFSFSTPNSFFGLTLGQNSDVGSTLRQF